MIDIEALLPQGPSAFEDVVRDWLDARPSRHTVEYVRPHPRRMFVVGDEVGQHEIASGLSSPRWGASTADEGVPSHPDDALPLEVAAFAGLLERGAIHLAAAKAAHRRQCADAAELARALAAFAATRPAAALDRPDGEVGAAAAASRAARPAVLTAVSEWAVDEVMVALGLSSAPASRLLAESVTLTEQLPTTLAALEVGTISPAHARMLVEVLAPVSDAAKRAEVETRLLAGAAGRTVAQLRVSARRAVLRVDAAAAAHRLATAIRDRRVRVFPGEDGMASWVASMTTPVALACHDALEQYAEACATPGDERTKDQRMVDCLADLILRPGETGLPPVQAQLTVVAGVDTLLAGNEPGEIDGHPIPAVVIRELAYALDLLPRPATGAQHPADATPARVETPEMTAPIQAPAADTAETTPAETMPAETTPRAEAATGPTVGREDLALSSEASAEMAVLAELLGVRAIAGTALAYLPALAVADEISGQLLALSTAAGIRAAATCARRACRTGRRPCTHLPDGPCVGPPPASLGYRPSDPLDRFTRARDRRCRFPGCRVPAVRCDLDHNQPWPAGTTSAENLCCLCRHHHRLSHQAPGWTMRRLPDGGLEWTTPDGDRITTHPPRYGSDDSPPATTRRPQQTSPPPEPPLTLRERVLGRPHPPGYVDDDPPPF